MPCEFSNFLCTAVTTPLKRGVEQIQLPITIAAKRPRIGDIDTTTEDSDALRVSSSSSIDEPDVAFQNDSTIVTYDTEMIDTS